MACTTVEAIVVDENVTPALPCSEQLERGIVNIHLSINLFMETVTRIHIDLMRLVPQYCLQTSFRKNANIYNNNDDNRKTISATCHISKDCPIT
ncbi:hypothetical protein E2C01_006871 [Portunus trituberculatus]|uniref:Uncharacterized protein n=1 Tax=Portunus trituberculatus TaxID=210409 RepID=A0A5B7CXY2_PORTR|nr:hypothetical protein [Portunus trituberculatus]